MNLIPGLKPFSERVKTERASRLNRRERILSFGVPFLDESLGGIFPNDLILIGAKTGFGKSQLAVLVALANARQGRRVVYFALEAEDCEIEQRIKFQMIAERFYADPARPHIYLNYLDWYCGRLDEYLKKYEDAIDSAPDIYPTLKVYYRSGGFSASEFERVFFAVKDEVDLVITDHLHYFDFDDDNENRAIKEIMKKMRDCALITGVPNILIAHVRKSDRRAKQLLPDIDDFHGSSDIGKIVTKALTISPNYEGKSKTQRQTYVSILKCRVDGSRAHHVAALAFNLNKHAYEREYYLGKLSSDGTEFIPYDFASMPEWARNGKAYNNHGGPAL